MNSNDREELARLLPAPVERDLPGDRHHQLLEFVMSEMQPVKRRPLMRRSVLVTSALTAAVAVAAAVGVAVTARQPDDAATPPAALTTKDILLAAAKTTEQQPDGSGKYWHVRVEQRDTPTSKGKNAFDTWADRDGVNWVKLEAPDPARNPDAPVADRGPLKFGDTGFSVAGVYITFDELQGLPTTPDELKTAVTKILDRGKFEQSAGVPMTAQERAKYDLYGLFTLVSTLPAPAKVRAAAYQAISTYPEVVSLGTVDGGHALEYPVWGDSKARLIIEPATAQIRRTNFLVFFNQTMGSGDPDSKPNMYFITEWTDNLPAK